ncbi:hypothetical protein AD942_03780 [Gluconobacter japonicus]|uniref:restriction endonuclease subunit S n=1 Tax=Gluconobacter japonicus TaxID=376620 RepID=UPI000783D6AF|nr:restriction endonuclease subunit S [Gluconobacter japonicus]KXV41037.1 hypothetical protein AD942_03780 [Gluconobacter japonicus]KXV48580.1 hypothetical protein AD936_10610 [Gluconobacter japonicus]
MIIAAYPKHESYTDCGIDWIGEVPSTWSIEPGRQCLYESKEKNIGMKESTVLSLSYGRVIVKDEDKLTGLVPESFETYQVVQPGDIIIRGTDLQNDMTSLRTGLARDTGIITSAYINLRPKADIDPKFLHYLLHSYDVKKVFYALGSGLRQNLSYEDFKYLRLPIPTLQEQRAIAAFLDGKCATIDEAVRIKEEQIRLLAERRQILIQEAVTRGLNPDAPMKNSGIDWIGRIPAHWEILKLRNMGGFQNGISEAAEYFGSGHPFITYGDVFNNEVLPQNASGLAKSDSRAQTLYSVRAGDIFFTRTSEITSEIGIASAATSDIPKATFSGFLIRFRPKAGRIVPEYARFLFRSDYVRMFFAHEVNIVTRASLGQELLKNLPVFAPPRDEQARIATWLEGKTKDLDGAIDLKKSQITALREYKTSLINAAVTGKIKVL